MRNVRDVHDAWRHKVPEEERALYSTSGPVPPHVDVTAPMAWAWLTSRLAFIALMFVVMLAAHGWLLFGPVLQGGSSGGDAVAGVAGRRGEEL